MRKVKIFTPHPFWFLLLPVSRRVFNHLAISMQEIICQNGQNVSETEIFLVNDQESAVLNEKYMHRTGPTNILSFPGDNLLSSSLLLSLDTYARECRIYRQKKIPYLIELLAHGFAHLPGLEHGPEHARLACLCEREAIKSIYNLRENYGWNQ